MEISRIQHWIVAVARSAGLDGAAELDVPADASMEAAWSATALTAGIDPDALARRVADHYRLPVADLDGAGPNAHRLLPGTVARKLQVLPLRYSDRALTVATADPVAMDAEREIAQVSGRTVHFEIAPPGSLARVLRDTYPESADVRHDVPPLEAEARGEPETKERLHVLVVEDDADARGLLRLALEEAGFRVTEAPDGPEALDLVERGNDPFALVTLDLKMDKMDGLDVLKRIRGRMATATLPVIVATGSDDPAAEMELFNAGADDFVVKPVDPRRFILRVQAVLRRRNTGFLQGLL